MIGLLLRRRLVLGAALLTSLLGAAAWGVMPRQEDPSMPDTYGVVNVALPGADAATVEERVVRRIEDALARVDGIRRVTTVSRAGVATFDLQLLGRADPGETWPEVREAIESADLPPQASRPVLRHDLMPTEAVLLAVVGDADRRTLADAADRLEARLRRLPEVRDVLVHGDPGRQVTVALDADRARHFGVDAGAIAAQLRARSSGVPGGVLQLGARQASLRPQAELRSAREVRATPIRLPAGSVVPLSALADVHDGTAAPERARFRVNGRPAVGLGVVPRAAIHVPAFGDGVRRVLDEMAPALAPLTVEEVSYQPDQVEARLADLGRSLVVGMLVVAALTVLALGVRPGLLVAAVVPAVTLSSLALYFLAGGVLHQMSVAAFVLALGLLVDNAIVIAEGLQRRLDEGIGGLAAASATVRELALPLGVATGTTMAVFVPMLLAEGDVAVFTRAIPQVLLLTLALSYLFALVVTPTLGVMVLRPRAGTERDPFRRIGDRLGRLAAGRPVLVAATVGAAVVLVGLSAGRVEQRFFPSAGRPELMVSLELPEGADLDATDAVARGLEAELSRRADVVSIATSVGRPAPRVYYNLRQARPSPHVAQLIVRTPSPAHVEPLAAVVRDWMDAQHPGVATRALALEQGPGLEAPISVRIVADNLAAGARVAELVRRELRAIDGVRAVRSNLGIGVPSAELAVNDDAAAAYGLSRHDLGEALLARTIGVPGGTLLGHRDPVPVRVRAPEGERIAPDQLAATELRTPDGRTVPLAAVGNLEASWQPAVIMRHNRRRAVLVNADLDAGVPFGRVLEALAPRLDELELPAGVAIEMAGAEEGSNEANTALLRTLPVGLGLLVLLLLLEFDSLRRLGLILATVPLSAVGIVPGLLLGGQPFGFMSLLGVIALVGIVVNNAIVLLDVVEMRRKEGAPIREALEDAVRLRTRPILLTTGTTVAGMLPLAFSASPLWPPLAWAMISGLVASTMLTLVLVPAAYRLLFRDRAAAT